MLATVPTFLALVQIVSCGDQFVLQCGQRAQNVLPNPVQVVKSE